MRAPLTFLLAAGIMVGGGYAGVVWLASPSTIGYGASSRSQNAGNAPNANVALGTDRIPRDRSSNSSVVIDELRAGRKTATEESKSLRPLRTESRDEGDAAIGPSSSAQQATGSSTEPTAKGGHDAPAGGCMPFGITARGNLVFPMECRELLERHRGVHASLDNSPRAPPEQAGTVKDVQTAGSVRDDDIQTTGLAPDLSVQSASAVPKHDLQTVGSVADQNAANSPSKSSDVRTGPVPQPRSKIKLAKDGSRTSEDGNRQEKVLQFSRVLNGRHQQRRFSELLKDPLKFNCMNCLLFGY